MTSGLLAAVVLLQVILLSAVLVLLYLVLRQQGRTLASIDGLQGGRQAVTGRQRDSTLHATGLPIGAPVPDFRLPDLSGKTVDLDDFRGRALLLVNWDPRCGFCEIVAADLVKLQPGLEAGNVCLALVSRGDVEINRKFAEEHRLQCPVLLSNDAATAPEMFALYGTPAAYLLDEAGRVAAPLAVGARGVSALARRASGEKGTARPLPGQRSLAHSRIERNGLKAGVAAPGFRLRDLSGGTVSLDDYRGRQLLLVFSDPACGPCDRLAPNLEQWHRGRGGDPAILMIGRGDLAENRRKAEAHGLTFPVAVQRKWEVSRQYGIFATPVGFLIDEHGVVARDVARGAEEILGLLRVSVRAAGTTGMAA
jgi:peroxiredoxin